MTSTSFPSGAAPAADALATAARVDGISAALRVAGLLCLLLAVWRTRIQVRRTIGYAALIDDLGSPAIGSPAINRLDPMGKS